LKDAEDIIRILQNAFGDPDPVATARAKLANLKQGKKEFNTYFAKFQMLVSKLNWNEDDKLDALWEGMSHDLRRLLLGRTKKLSFNELVALCQETDTESYAIHLSEGRSHQHQLYHQNHSHPHTPTTITTPINYTVLSSASQTPDPDTMDLSATVGRGKISEQERAARLRQGRCLYCRGVGHMARHCPNKNRNPFCAAGAQVTSQQNQNLPDTGSNPNLNTFANHPNPDTFANPFSGAGGVGNRGGGTGGEGQLGNA
jgi:hypothetical protein